MNTKNIKRQSLKIWSNSLAEYHQFEEIRAYLKIYNLRNKKHKSLNSFVLQLINLGFHFLKKEDFFKSYQNEILEKFEVKLYEALIKFEKLNVKEEDLIMLKELENLNMELNENISSKNLLEELKEKIKYENFKKESFEKWKNEQNTKK